MDTHTKTKLKVKISKYTSHRTNETRRNKKKEEKKIVLNEMCVTAARDI